MYTSEKFTDVESQKSSTKLEILGIINSLNSFHLYIQDVQFTFRTDWKNIKELYNEVQKKNFEISKRWINFLEVIIGRGYKANFEHITSKNTELADILSRLITNW